MIDSNELKNIIEKSRLFEKELEIAELVRKVVTVGRVIVFGGTGKS